MSKIKGWKKTENDTYIMWSNQHYPLKLNDIYTIIEFVKPKRREIGYLYIKKVQVNWIDGLASSGITKVVFHVNPKTKEEGINIATNYMKSHPNG